MEALINYIKEEVQDDDSRFKPMVDTGELIDVRVAERARIGFVGKNGLLITKEFGSYVHFRRVDYEYRVSDRWNGGLTDAAIVRAVWISVRQGATWATGVWMLCAALSYQTQTKGFMPQEFQKKSGMWFTAVIFASKCVRIT